MTNDNSEIIARLVKALDATPQTRGRGRVKEISVATGYSEGMVSRILAGKVDASDKFIMAICSAYSINREWLASGNKPVGSILTGEPEGVFDENSPVALPAFMLRSNASDVMNNAMLAVDALVPGLGEGLKDPAIREGVKEMLKMPESERWKTVGELKFKNELLCVEKEMQELDKTP